MKVKCDYCGLEFEKPSSKVPSHNFCCKDHYDRWQRGENFEEKHRRICALCNKAFEDSVKNRLEWYFSAHLYNEHQVPLPGNVKVMADCNKHFDRLQDEGLLPVTPQ